jgi:STE24 endopeptidase
MTSIEFVEVSEHSLSKSPEAKSYNRTKLTLSITSAVLSFILILAVVLTGLSTTIARWSLSTVPNEYGALLLFVGALGILQSVITLPFSFYSSYVIEHRYGLSSQSLARWVWERLKGLLVGLPLVAGILVLLYACLAAYGDRWWVPVGLVLVFLSVVLARIAPVVVFPLFYRFKQLEDGTLKERITELCKGSGIRIEGVFTFDLSRNTRKANAAFTGIGKTRRVILGDTLLHKLSEEEIETIVAHEIGHYVHKHILIGIGTGIVSTFLGLFVTAQLYSWSLTLLGFDSLNDMAALPLLALWLALFGMITGPLGNALSRYHERQADAHAIVRTRNKRAFVSALQTLAKTNLADPDPHPLIEFLFYSHPSVGRRITFVESLQV